LELATDSAIAALESAQSKYDAYLNAFNSVQQAADQYMRDQWYTSQADWDVLSAIQKLPRDIAGLKPSPEQAQKIGAALAAFGSGAGVMVENSTFVVNTAVNVHRAAEIALAVGGSAELTYFGYRLLREEGLSAFSRKAAALVAASTAVNFGSQQAVALAQEHGVDPALIRIGADGLQVALLILAANANRQAQYLEGTPATPTARATLNAIEQNGGNPLQGYVGGRTFQNREGRLPFYDGQGNRITYMEHDVYPIGTGPNRGAERIVIGNDGKAYFTNNHYDSFREITQ
jgi:guanyl-specific ribonuclease Sa